METERLSTEQQAIQEKQNVWEGYDEDVGIVHDSHKTAYRPDRPNKFGVKEDEVIISKGYVPVKFSEYDDKLLSDDVDWKEPLQGLAVIEDDYGTHFKPVSVYSVRYEERERERIKAELENERFTKEYWNASWSTRRNDAKYYIKKAVSDAYNKSYEGFEKVEFWYQKEQIRKKFLVIRKENLKIAFDKFCRLYFLDVDSMKDQYFGTTDLRSIRPVEIKNAIYKIVDNYVKEQIKENGIRE